MADTEKLDITSHLRDLTAVATENYYAIRRLLDEAKDAGFLPADGEVVPENPITDADFADTIHAGLTAAQWYAVAQQWDAIGVLFDPTTRRLFKLFGKPLNQQ